MSSTSLRTALDAGLNDLNTRAPRAQHVVVVGGGMAGISTAYWLGRAGNAVTVIEAAPAPVAPVASSASGASSIPGSAASYTGLLSLSTSLAPFFARPQMFRAQKVQWCPRTLYSHPNLRLGLFQGGAIARHVRMGITPHAKRPEFQQSLVRLFGLAMWNQALVRQVSRDWQQQQQQSAAQSSATEPVDGTLAVVFDDRTFADLINDTKTQHALTGDEPNDVLVPARPAGAAALRSASSNGRVSVLDDGRDFLQLLPSLKAKQFSMAGVLHAQDEFAVDHLAFLQRMRQDSETKYGVKYVYDTTVTALITEQQKQQAAGATAGGDTVVSTASSRIVSAETSRGPVSGDAFVLCAGPRSKSLVHASHLPGLAQAVPTFTTKTHYVVFPNPDAAAAAPAAAAVSNDGPLFPHASVALPESQVLLTPFAREVRVSIGNDLNVLDEPNLPRAASASQAREEAATAARAVPLESRLEPVRLQALLSAVSSVFPRADKSVVSGGGLSVPGAALRTWSFDSKPLLGRYSAATPNLFVNGAHGNLGWAHALAAGQHVSNIVSGLPTFLQGDAFDPRRFDTK